MYSIYLKIVLIFTFLSFPFYSFPASRQTENNAIQNIPLDSVSTADAASDTIVKYYGSPIEYTLDKKIIYIFGDQSKPAKVVYKNMSLEAGKITVLLDSSLIIAESIQDTGIDGKNNTQLTAVPIFKQEGQEPFSGKRIVYNIKTKKGVVKEGRTKFEDGHYFGEDITMLKEKVFQIKNGFFTTCDIEDHPHFRFKGGKMKMVADDKIVVKPIIIYIRDVPVFYFPFAVLPIRRGRHSGILFPTFGTTQNEGRFLRGLGYYFAPNDYMDVKLIADYFEKSGFMLRGDSRYSKRYILSGNITGSITNKNIITGGKEKRWDLQIDHRHKISPDMNFSINGKFASDGSFYKNMSLNRNYRSIRELISNATLNKNWQKSKNSISINIRRRQDLELGNISETFPQISFNHTSPIYLFKRNSSESASTVKEKWFNTINFRYNSVLVNRNIKRRNSVDEPFDEQMRNGTQHSLNILAPQKIFKHLVLNPSLSYREEWFLTSDKMILDQNQELTQTEEKGFASRRIFNTGFSANTKIYGMFSPNLGNIKAIRHTITPSISFSYQPDFSSEGFGYYTTAIDSLGEPVRYDRFSSSIFGGTPAGKSQSMSLSLQNLFQMKTSNGEKESKSDLFNLDFSTNYNFTRENFKLGNLRTSFRTLSFFDIDFHSVHSFYPYDAEQRKVVDKIIKGFPRLVNFQAVTSFRLTGSKEESTVSTELTSEENFETTTKEDKQNRFFEDSGSPSMGIPWNFSMGLRYTLNKFNPVRPDERFSITPKLDFKLTKNWKIDYRAEFDLISKKIIYNDFTFYRDLHCWELRFDWSPVGRLKGFFVIIRIKSPNLKDLKIEKRNYGGSTFGRGYY